VLPSALPALPDLAHTRPSPLPWLATATVMAGVVALAGFLTPDPATASQGGMKPAAVAAPDTTAAAFPLNCGNAGSVVTKKETGDLDRDGRPETVAVARCDAGSGTPPSGLYVVTQPLAQGGAPRVVATLVAPGNQQTVGALTVRDGVVTAILLGYSSPEVPRWKPDLREKAKWRWQGGKFVRSVPVRAGDV
jgi:hypothetical protein